MEAASSLPGRGPKGEGPRPLFVLFPCAQVAHLRPLELGAPVAVGALAAGPQERGRALPFAPGLFPL